MDAKRARELTEQALNEKKQREIERCEKTFNETLIDIQTYANYGKSRTSCEMFKSQSGEYIRRFKELGYIVHYEFSDEIPEGMLILNIQW